MSEWYEQEFVDSFNLMTLGLTDKVIEGWKNTIFECVEELFRKGARLKNISIVMDGDICTRRIVYDTKSSLGYRVELRYDDQLHTVQVVAEPTTYGEGRE